MMDGDGRLATRFTRDGYAVLPQLLTGAELDVVRSVVDEALAAPLHELCERPNNTLVPLRWNDQLVAAMLHDDGRMRRVRDAVAARDLRWISGYISVKVPHSPSLWWHQDWWCWDHSASYRRPASQVALLCYLTDTSPANGALRILPGSHTRSFPVHAELPEAHAESNAALDAKHVAMRDQPGQVTVDMRAGDAVLLDYRLLHSTHPNDSGQRRDCVILNFAPSWRELPAEIRGHLVAHLAQPRPDESRPDESRPEAGWESRLLPTFDGPRRDLDLSRDAPANYVIG